MNTPWDNNYKLWLPRKSHLCGPLEVRAMREAAAGVLLQYSGIGFGKEGRELKICVSPPASLARAYLISESIPYPVECEYV